MSSVTEEKIIEAVKERPFLYNKKDPSYKDKPKRTNAWTEIAMFVGLDSGKDAEASWKELRRQYTSYLAKLNKPSGSARGNPPTFRHSMTMSFYQEFYKPYKSVSNLEDQNGDGDGIDDLLDPEAAFESSSSTTTPGVEVSYEGFENNACPPVVFTVGKQTETPRAPPKSRFIKKRRNDEVDEMLIAALEKTNSEADEFDHFGALVASRVRKFDRSDALLAAELQAEIQQLLVTYERKLQQKQTEEKQ